MDKLEKYQYVQFTFCDINGTSRGKILPVRNADSFEKGLAIYAGKPVDLYDETNPDWAPSLKMGHEKLGFSKTSKDRYERISKRKATIKAKAAEMFREEELCPNEAPDDSTNTDCNVETQTDLNG
ncbi:uncharacterized protein LOC121367563 isoform X2 [Gigantopelta aegis]|uniref:uncharacterized protein LOC121367563 isoform X2 n=1 Tax=Gigantopelta aegis TaxID=1735272 RepID=UPI001B888CD7|nr:uncharacterized protein LOC121367563 isoform X2 [Gigantopelta aegis]